MDPNANILEQLRRRDIIDVRSPSEFARDHVPGAVNLPVLDDAERARIGTMYTRISRFEARRQGAVLVARNIARHIETALAGKDGSFAPLVYCWRGGMRSGAMAHVLGQVGWRAEVLDGGYRSYRRAVTARLYEVPLGLQLMVLAGPTGSGKTELLARVKALGGQVIDLEALARHRGSLFGGFAGKAQPSQKAFESALAAALGGLDPARPVLVEDESSKIGKLLLPPSFWAGLCAAPRVVVEAPVTARAAYLNRVYADITGDQARLEAVLGHLVPLCGKERVAGWRDLAAEARFADLAAVLMQEHYDPAYARSMARHSHGILGSVSMAELGEGEMARAAAELLRVMDAAAGGDAG